jgi:hypothetical protein
VPATRGARLRPKRQREPIESGVSDAHAKFRRAAPPCFDFHQTPSAPPRDTGSESKHFQASIMRHDDDEISRRSFLAGAGAGAGDSVLATSVTAAPAAAEEMPDPVIGPAAVTISPGADQFVTFAHTIGYPK